jgi:PKD repeat protein
MATSVMLERQVDPSNPNWPEKFRDLDKGLVLPVVGRSSIEITYPERLRGGFVIKKDSDYLSKFSPKKDVSSRQSQFWARTLEYAANTGYVLAETVATENPVADVLLTFTSEIQRAANYIQDVSEISEETDTFQYSWNFENKKERKIGSVFARFFVLLDPNESVDIDISVSAEYFAGNYPKDTLGKTITLSTPEKGPVSIQKPTAVIDAPNEPPQAGETATFDASRSTSPEGKELQFRWYAYIGSQLLTRGSGERFQVSFPESGKYPIRLEVTDEDGKADVASTTVSVAAEPSADRKPEVSINGPDTTYQGSRVTYTAEASDPDKGTSGRIVRYEWSGAVPNTGGEKTSPRWNSTGERVVRCEVTDDEGNTASDSITVQVTPREEEEEGDSGSTEPPSVSIDGPRETVEGSRVTYTANASDPDGEITSYEWFGAVPNTGDDTTSPRWISAGEKAVGCRVTDDAGATAETSLTVRVEPRTGDEPPSVSITGPTEVYEGSRVTYTADATDPDQGRRGEITSYEWFGPVPSTGKKTTSPQWRSTGERTLGCRVTDDEGNSVQETLTVEVKPRTEDIPPTLSVTGPTDIDEGSQATYTATATDPDQGMPGDIVSYEWFGSVSDTGDDTVTIRWSSPGEKTVGCRVTDDENNTIEDSITVDVNKVNQPPTASFDVNPPDPGVDQLVIFDGGESQDPDGSVTQYEWQISKSKDGETTQIKSSTGKLLKYRFPTPDQYQISLTVTDDGGATSTETLDLSPEAVEKPDAKITAPDQPIPTETEVTFSGEPSTTPYGDPSYFWTVDHDGESIHVTTGKELQYTFSEAGEFTVNLTVNDGGFESMTSVDVSVGYPPKARFDVKPSTTPAPDETVTFDASPATDPGGSITAYEWEFYQKPSQNSETATGRTVTRSFSDGTHAAVLTVTDESGLSDRATKTIEVSQPPVARFEITPDSPTSADRITFDATASRGPDVSIATYEWSFEEKGSEYRETASGETVTRELSKGRYTVTLTVEDETGNTDTLSKEVDVSSTEPLVARFELSPSSPNTGEAVTFDASESTVPDRSTGDFEWEVYQTGGDTLEPDPVAALSGETVRYAFQKPVTHRIELTVTDDSDRTDTTSKRVKPRGQPDAVFEMRPPEATPTEQVLFDASESENPGGSITSYEWTFQEKPFGNRETASGVTVTRKFSKGTYAVTLTIADDSGNTATATKTLDISPDTEPEPPVPWIDIRPESPSTDEQVTFDGSLSADPDGSITDYEWNIYRTDGETSGVDPIETLNGETVTYRFTEPVTHTVELIVTDDSDRTGRTERVIRLNTAPEAAFEMRPPHPTPGDEVTLDATPSSDPDGTLTSWEWNSQEKPFGNPDMESGQTVNKVFSKGEYAVTLTVTDNSGAVDEITRTLVVADENQPPRASIDAPSETIYTGATVDFDGSVSHDPDGDIVSYDWEINPPVGDTVTKSGASILYNVSDAGIYQIELTVTDNEGATDITRTSITVDEAPFER